MNAETTPPTAPPAARPGRRRPWNRPRLAASLPPAIRRYVGLPTRLAVAWLVFSALGLFALRAFVSPVAAQQLLSPAALPRSLPEPASLLGVRQSVVVGGAGDLSITRGEDDTVTATCGSGPPLRVVGDATDVRLVDADGTPRYRLELVEPTKSRILDGSGDLVWRVKREIEGGEETFKLYDGTDTIRHRTKIKSDSFNIYASGSERIAKGKPRDGAFESRPESGGASSLVTGPVTLRQAAVLSLPVAAPVRALLWIQAGD